MIAVVAALIKRGDRLLICQRRADQAMPLKWEFPGGKIDPGEQPEAALRRELEEELGIQAIIGSQFAHVRHEYSGGPSVDLHFFTVREWQGEIENRIFAEIRWTPASELAGYDFLEADRQLVANLTNAKHC